MKFNTIAAALLSTTMLTACADMDADTRQMLGQVGGAVVGGYLGSKVGDGQGKVFATIIGTMAGAYLGDQIVKHLSAHEVEQVSAMQASTLDNASVGQGSSWSNPDQTKSAQTTVTAETTQTRKVHMVKKPEIVTSSKLTMIGEPYKSLDSLRVRSGPGTNYDVIAGLMPGQVINAVGQDDMTGWYLLSSRHQIIGWAHPDFLRPATGASDVERAQIAEATGKGEARGAYNLDDIHLQDGMEVATIEAETTCKTVETSYNLDEPIEPQKQTFCKAPDGAWEIG